MREVSTKLALMVAAAAIAVSSFPLIAQQADSTTPQATETAKTEAGAPVELRPVSGELQGKLDTKNAKIGDSVVLKAKAAVKIADGTEIPKGAKLIGRVTDVQARGPGSADSRVALEFDRAELKGGQSLTIRTVIESIQAPVDLSAQSAADGGGLGGGPGGRGGGGAAGGGMGHGTTGGTSNTADSPIGGMGSAVPGAEATANAGSIVRQVPGQTGGVEAHATGVPGVYLSSQSTASASGMLFASKKNVHLDDGTLITLGVATGPNSH